MYVGGVGVLVFVRWSSIPKRRLRMLHAPAHIILNQV